MLSTALDDLAQLWQIFCGREPANASSRNGDPNSTRTQPKKGNGVGIKKKEGFSYFQYQVKISAAAVPLPQEPVADQLPQQISLPPFRDQVWLLKRKVQSLENNNDIINGLKQKNKDTIKNLSVAFCQNQALKSV